MALLQRAKDSGKCPPSLLTENRMTADDGFEAAVTKVLEINNNGKRASSFLDITSGLFYDCYRVVSNAFLSLLLFLQHDCLLLLRSITGLSLAEEGDVAESFQEVMKVSS